MSAPIEVVKDPEETPARKNTLKRVLKDLQDETFSVEKKKRGFSP